MISSDRMALKVGSSRLVVDGTDDTLCRKAEISLSPGRTKCRALDKLVGWSLDVYNGALQQRRDAWHLRKVAISRFDQFNEVPALRPVCPEVARFGIQPTRGAISRADEAFAGFFRRIGDGEKAGYPRFKSAGRYRTVFYDEPYNWKLRNVETDDGCQPALYVGGVGEIPISKKAVSQLLRLIARGGEPRTLTITKSKSGAWRACVGFRGVAAKRLEESDQVGGVDRGIWVTAALPDGRLLRCPGFLRHARTLIADLQREQETFPKGSPEWIKRNRAIAKAYRRAHHQSENWARHTAIDIVASYGVISVEDLNLVSMAKSAKGTIQCPGKGVARKKGLNRSLQDAALGRLSFWICVKAEEAGRRVWKVNPRNSSRECAACGHTEAANRFRTRFECKECPHTEHADVNAAQVITARGQSADSRWKASGGPLLKRPLPRNRRRNPATLAIAESDETKALHGAGSAPHASAAQARG